LGLPVGAIDRARVLAACTDIRQADTLLSGGLPADQVHAQLVGAADALGTAAGLSAHPDVARLVTAWRAAADERQEQVAVRAALVWCTQNHG
jgi:hypothetical protein